MPQRRGNIMNAASWRAFWASCSCNQVGYPHCCQLPHACPTSWPLQTAVTQTLNDFVSGTCTWMEKAVKLMQSRAEGQVSRWAAADKVSKIEPRAGEPAIRASSIEQQIVMANVQKKKSIYVYDSECLEIREEVAVGSAVCSSQATKLLAQINGERQKVKLQGKNVSNLLRQPALFAFTPVLLWPLF